MTAISFKLDGSPEMILSGRKRTTFRKFSQSRDGILRNAAELQLFWKQRTKECYRIADAQLTMICVIPDMSEFLGFADDAVAYRDGFDSIDEMRRFFSENYTDEELNEKFHMIEFKVKEGGQ